MEWFVYLPFDLKGNCEHLETVENTAKWYSSQGLGCTAGIPSAFEKAWAAAQLAALSAGWDGGSTGAALLFWLPGKSGGFQHGFAWRQGDGARGSGQPGTHAASCRSASGSVGLGRLVRQRVTGVQQGVMSPLHGVGVRCQQRLRQGSTRLRPCTCLHS